MTETQIKERLLSEMDKLLPEDQRRVLEFAHTLARKGVTGKSLLRFAGAIPQPDLVSISQAIENDCEKVDDREW